MLKHCGTLMIKTERLILRRFSIEDTECAFKYWASNERVQSLYGEPVYDTLAKTRELILGYISSYGRVNNYRWAIVLKETNECVGQVAYFLVDDKNHFGELEYCIGEAFQRRGLTTEAVKAVIDFGFNNINFNKVQISHKEGNEASKRVILKNNLTFEGRLRDYFYTNGRYVSRYYYSILKNEWEMA